MLRHPVLWQFVSAPFPTEAVVKSHHMLSWVMKQNICFIVFSLWGKQVTLAFLPPVSEVRGSSSVCQVQALVQ